MNRIIEEQINLCKRLGTEYIFTSEGGLFGLNVSFKLSENPFNGLRHPIEGNASGWYMWSGEYSSEDGFFEPLHIFHLNNMCPKATKYLGLGPGWRFLFDDVFEDIWFDEALLHI